MTRSVDEFKPLEQGRAGMYTCGPTVYNYAHVGNLRTYVFEDILKRGLLWCGYDVKHVMNVTDVGHLVSDADEGEDKMALGAAREGKSVWELAELYFQAFKLDLDRLNIIAPDIWCKATEHIGEQIGQVRSLEQKGFTYIIDDGVYFDTSKLSDYGKLARLDIAGLRAGSRVEMAVGKKNLTDFALWKFSPKDATRLMEWESPWGVGFPGWHIECSAMAIKYLGERMDIHCGGIDHVSVHHTNEIAQAESAIGHEWVNFWLHGEFLVSDKGKISKSDEEGDSKAGEFLTLDLLVDRGFDPLAYRYFLLGAHYRQQLSFSWEALESAASAFGKLKRIALDIAGDYVSTDEPLEKPIAEFRDAVEDDLNMPRALAAMWGAAKQAQAQPGRTYAALLEMDRVLGFGIESFEADKLAISEDDILDMIRQRTDAKANKDYTAADGIRETLKEMGIEIMDGPEGTTWRSI